jgi:Holliday junction resolvase
VVNAKDIPDTMSSQYNYERELRDLLSGDNETLESVTKAFDNETKAKYYLVKNRPFLVIRAAGSFGEDLVALRGDVGFPIEVKASKDPLFHFSNTQRLKEQQEEFIRVCEQTKTLPIYAFRLKNVRGGDPWRIFTIETVDPPGNLGAVHDKLSKLQKTPNGYYKMPWVDGIPLSTFIEYMCK